MSSIAVVSVPVSDQDRAKRFYVDVLGFELVRDVPFGDDLRWLQIRPPGDSFASLTLVTWFDDMPAGSTRGLVIDTDDIYRDYDLFRGRGADIRNPPSQEVGGIFCFVPDPDGNVISFHQASSQ